MIYNLINCFLLGDTNWAEQKYDYEMAVYVQTFWKLK